MVTLYEGKLTAGARSFGIVVSRFNELITRRLLDGALDCLRRHGADDRQITVVWVPGAFELPLVAKKLAETKGYDVVICLGAVIRGATPHFEYVASESAKGIAGVSLSTGTPVIYGVVTADTIEQAIERAGTKAGNRGWDAALNALEMADLMTTIAAGNCAQVDAT